MLVKPRTHMLMVDPISFIDYIVDDEEKTSRVYSKSW